MDIKKQYDKIGFSYARGQDEFFGKNEDNSRKFIKKCLPDLKNKIVLDLGCGSGKDILIYEGLGAKEIYGLDSSKVMISEAKRSVKNPNNLIVGDMNSTPFKNKFFDIIIGRFSIHYAQNRGDTYLEISRILKKNGILILIVPHPIWSFMQLGGKNYLEKGLIKIKLYGNKVPIKYPNHILKDYFPETFFRLFYIDLLDEGQVDSSKQFNKQNVPEFLAFKAIKK